MKVPQILCPGAWGKGELINCNGCEDSYCCFSCFALTSSTFCFSVIGGDFVDNCDNSSVISKSSHLSNCTSVSNSIYCNNSSYLDSCIDCVGCNRCLFCSDLVGEKFMIFNQQVNEKTYDKIRGDIWEGLGFSEGTIAVHPTQLNETHIRWLEDNVKQFDRKVLNKIMSTYNSLPYGMRDSSQ